MMPSLPLQQAPKKICILRLSALGDVTHVVPVVRAIQKQWPTTEITWVCGVLESKLLSGLEGIRFIVFDKRQGWKAYTDLRQKLRHERFDVLLHMQVAGRANIASLFIKAAIRLGWDKSRSRDFHQLFVNHRVPAVGQQHQVQEFLSFARTLGIDVSEPEWDFPLSGDALAFAEQHIPGDKKTLLISACSSHPLRNWSIEGYAQVADYAIEHMGMQVVLSGGPSQAEQDMGHGIEQAMKQQPLNLVGKDTLQQRSTIFTVIYEPSGGATKTSIRKLVSLALCLSTSNLKRHL